ncbi:MAG: glutamate-5-semialdehyde dehydrogenase [Deltaproteobacteria bacterium]|nr:glutamate-5-semialdehyde dehydrogenase [Deltaproteobacteria bacterium]
MQINLNEEILAMARDARESSRVLRNAGRDKKDKALKFMAEEIHLRKNEIIKINAKDVGLAKKNGLSYAMIDRLKLNEKTIDSMVNGLREVASLPDPVGEIPGMWVRPNGLKVGRIRVPLGVIGFIYESRPNVTVDAAALCLKSGNAVLLKGGSEAINSNLILNEILNGAMEKADLPKKSIQVISSTKHEAVGYLLKMDDYVDVIIPRGGEGLIRFVAENSRIPVLRHFKGVCHVYVDKYADLSMAQNICFNAKVQRPGVCNAMETMLVHEDIAMSFLPDMINVFQDAGVEIRACENTGKIVPGLIAARESDWPAEFLDLVLAVKIVKDMDEAIDHIDKYGSKHTEAIVTSNYDRARGFLERVDASVVLVNASTRFNDGFELGLGAEIGINTSKLHSYGPMGLQELTTTKFIVTGSGQVRQ